MAFQRRRGLQFCAALILAGALGAGLHPAQAQPAMFAGKTVRFLVGTTPGGGYDIRARTVAKYIGAHLPGAPNVVVENMPGGGSAIAMNYLNAVAPKDGTAVCLFMRSIFTTLFDKPEAVKFDLDKFGWIGSTGADNGVVIAWHTAPHKTAQDLFTTEMIAAMPQGTQTQPAAINAIIGTKMKIITGYPGSPEMQTAMERGEVMGLGEISWSNLKLSRPDWIKERKVSLLLQIGLKRSPELADVPLPQEFAKTPEERQILDIVAAQRQFAYPIVLPPGVPADRVAAWQKAFLDLQRDAAFMAEIAKLGLEFDPTSGDEMARNMKELAASITPDLAKRIRSIVGLAQ